MELNEMEKRLLFLVEGDYQSKVLNELYMTARYTKNPEQRKAAENLMAKLRGLTDAECMDIVRDIQKNYRLPYPARTIGEKIAEARQQSGAEKLMCCIMIPLWVTGAIRCACSLQMPATRNS